MTENGSNGDLVGTILAVRRDKASKDFVLVDEARNIWVCRGDIMSIGNEIFVRQFTPDGRGGGFVALRALVPEDVAIPYDWMVYAYTVVLPKADHWMAGQGPKIDGLVANVSRQMSDDERKTANVQALERFRTMR